MADEGVTTDQPAGPDTSEIVMYVAGGVLLVASFLPLLEIDLATSKDDSGFGEFFGALIDTEWTAWSNAFSIFPMVTLPVLCVLVLVGLRALVRFAGTSVPERSAGFPLPVVRAAIAAFAGVAVLAQALRVLVDSGNDEEGSMSLGTGGWLAILALVAIVVTALQEAKAVPPVDADRRRPDQRAAAVTIGGAAVMLVASFLEVWSMDGDGVTAWGEGGRPVYLVPLLLAVLTAVATAVDLRSEEPGAVLGVDLGRWRVVLGALTLFSALALLIGNPFFGSFGSLVDTGAGVYVSLLGAAAVLVGTLLKPVATTAPAAGIDPVAPPAAPPSEPPG